MQNFKADKYTTRVYNILAKDFETGGNGFTRSEIEKKVGKRFKDQQWRAVMKKVRERVSTAFGLVIPRATIEGGWVYKITDDPNELVPGALINMRTIASNTEQSIKDQRFMELREDKLDPTINGPVFEQMKILSESQQLLERSMQIVNANLRRNMDERRDMLNKTDELDIDPSPNPHPIYGDEPESEYWDEGKKDDGIDGQAV